MRESAEASPKLRPPLCPWECCIDHSALSYPTKGRDSRSWGFAIVAPAVGGAVFRAAKTAVNALDGASDAARVVNKADDLADAAKAAGKADGIAPSASQVAPQVHWPSKPHGSEAHWSTIRRKAADMAASGKYTDIHINKALSTATDGAIPSRLRPDIVGRRLDGRFDVVEIVSPSQAVGHIEDKVEFMKGLMGPYFGSGRVVVP